MTTTRVSCGTHMGLLLHAEADEPPCGQCQLHDAWLSLARELIPTRPTRPAPPAQRTRKDRP